MKIELVDSKTAKRLPFDVNPLPKPGDHISLGEKTTTLVVKQVTYVLSDRQDKHVIELLVDEVG